MTARDSQRTGRLRLRHLNEVTEAKEEEMVDAAPRFGRLARNESATKAFSAFNLFTTPPDLAKQLIDLADIHPGHYVLEPSAGTGNLLRAIKEKFDRPSEGRTILQAHVQVTAVEIDGPLWHHLSDSEFAMFTNARLHDFLTWDTDQKYDRVVMNPPFKNGIDRRHILRAADMLKPGGRLVSLCAAGPRQRKTLMPIVDQWIDLPEGSFKSEGTNVDVAFVIINR